MAQISYGTITITDTTDIERIYPVYCKGGENTAPSLQPLSNWSETVSQAGGSGDYIWQRIVTKKQNITVVASDYSDAVRLTGDDGSSLTIIKTQYAQTQNENGTPSYGDSIPSPINEGWWLWTKTIYSDGSEVVIKIKQGQKGETGQRGTSILKVTTAPTTYTTTQGGFTPSYRMSLSTVKSQSGKDEVLIGDIIEYNSNHYRVGYVNSSYVYLSAATSIKGTDGQTYYTWIKYAPNDNPTNAQISDNPTGMTYIGIYIGTTTPAPSTASSYAPWMKYIGTDGGQGPQGISVTGTRELYWLKTTTNPSQITWNTSTSQPSQTIYSTDRKNSWTSVVPTYEANAIYYTCIETSLSNATKSWSAPIENKGLTNANQKALDAYNTSTARDTEVNALKAQAKHYWWDSQGAHVAAGENTTSVDNITQGSPSTYGFNSLMAPGYLALKYKDINFAQLATNSLTFYRPAINGSTYVQGKKGMDLTADALTFYKPLAYNSSNEPTAAAILNANGLVLSEGGVKFGTAGNSGFVYLSSADYSGSPTISIGNNNSGWREIIGTKFGVKNDGTLYATSANITGAIVATSLDLTTNNVKIGTGNITGLSTVATTGSYNSLSGTPDLTVYIAKDGTIGTEPSSSAASTSNGFVVSSAGVLKAANAVITGKIFASSGVIGGWNIGTDTNKSLYYGNQTPGATTTNLVLSPQSVVNSNSIAGSNTNKRWFISAGQNFGVDTSGNLFATGAKINGAITATSLTIGGTSGYNGIDALNITGYTIEILQNSSHSSITNPTENIWIYPVLYHNNSSVTVSDKTAFIWYKDDSTTGIAGNATDGGILGVYGSTYRVTYTFNDGAVVDGASPVQTVTVSDITHITEVNSTGIRVHPSSGNHYIQIDSTGLEVVQGGTSVAKYGTAARIGTTTGSRFLMNSNSLQAYNSSGTKYFEVTSSGLNWNNGTTTNYITYDASNGLQIASASPSTATRKIQILSNGINIKNDSNNYLSITSSKIALFKNNIEKLQLTDSLLRLGDSNNYVSIDSDSLDIYNNQTRLATFYSEGAEIGENSTTAKIGFNQGRGSITARDLTGSTTGQYDLTFGIDDTGWGSNYYALVTGLKARKVMSNTDESVSRLDVMANNNGASFNMLASHPQYNSSGDDIGSAWPSISGTTENTGLNGVLNLKVFSTVAGTIESEGIEVRTNINSARTSKTTYINFTGNYITFNGTTIHSSDKRLKTHINYLGKEAIDFISALHPAYFSLKEQKTTGFYAQEVEYIDPWNCFVNEDINGYKTLNYIGLIAPLVTYCQHLEKRISELEIQLEGV